MHAQLEVFGHWNYALEGNRGTSALLSLCSLDIEGGYPLSSVPTAMCCLIVEAKINSRRVSQNKPRQFLTDFIFLNGVCVHMHAHIYVYESKRLTLALFLHCFIPYFSEPSY